jgi:hypothetical protein
VRPLAIFAIVVVVGLLAIGAALRLTDHSASAKPSPAPAPPPLTHAQFVRAGNEVCARYYRDGIAIFKKQPKTLKMLRKDLRIMMPLMDRHAAGLRALVPPRSDARGYRRLLRVEGQELYGAHAVLHAFRTGQVRRGVLIARHLDHLDKRFNSLSRKLGLNICGLTGRQVRARYG